MSKFNVNEDTAKRTYDGIIFDSALEMRYYRDVVMPAVKNGEIIEFSLQKPYELQPAFIRGGKKILPIKYVADFYIKYADGSVEVIDTKGMPDSVAKIKRKLFWNKYPDIDYKWITYIKKFGGWIDYEAAKEMRKREKLNKRDKGDDFNGKDQ